MLETLVQRSRLFRYIKLELYLFAKRGFTKGCRDLAEELGNVNLVTYPELLEVLLAG